MFFCRYCGSKIPRSENICKQCGLPIASFDSLIASPEFLQMQEAEAKPNKKPVRPWWKRPKIIAIFCSGMLLVVLSTFLIGLLVSSSAEVPATPSMNNGINLPKPHSEALNASDGALVSNAFFDNSHHTEYNTGIFAIPQINLEGTEIRTLNKQIYRELYTDLVKGLLKNWTDGQNSGKKVTYDYYEAGDVLSLVVEVRPVDWEWTDYYVYNVSISEARVLSDDEVIAASGVEDYQKTTKEALKAYFLENYATQGSTGDFYDEQLDKTCAQSNINEAVPYLNSIGELCVIAPIYSLAGAEYYLHRVNLENPDDLFLLSAATRSEFMIPDSDSRIISESELHGLSEQECWLVLNEIYARHGRIFALQEYAEYFNSKSWYHGTIEGSDFDANVDNYLNSVELKNIATITKYQTKMGWRKS